jgi:hypothetical protein
MVASGVAQRFDLFILTCLRNVFRRATFGRIPLDKWSARRRDLYLTTHNTHNRQTSMPRVEFEPTISAGERPKTYALDRAAKLNLWLNKSTALQLSIEQSISWDIPNCSVRQGSSRVVCNRNCSQSCYWLDHMLSQMNPVNITTCALLKDPFTQAHVN